MLQFIGICVHEMLKVKIKKARKFNYQGCGFAYQAKTFFIYTL